MELRILNNMYLGNQLTSNFVGEWSKDEKIFILTDTNVFILKLHPSMSNTDNIFSFSTCELNLSDYHVANETGINIDEALLHLERLNLYHAILNYNITPRVNNVNPVQVRPINVAWSPLFDKVQYNSFLAVVSNTGNVEIYIHRRNKMVLLINLTKCLIHNYVKPLWNLENIPENYDKRYELHAKRIHEIIASCVTWGRDYEINDAVYMYIIVGYVNGNIAIWKINVIKKFEIELEAEKIFSVDLNLKRITTLHYCSSKDRAFIIAGDIDGIVKYISYSNEDNIEHNQVFNIWTYKDIRVSYINSFNFENNPCVIIVKGPNLIVALLNQENNVHCLKHLNLGNINISGVKEISHRRFMITTITGIIKILEIKINDNKIDFEISSVVTDIKWDFHGCHGLIKSPDNIIWGLVLFPCKMTDHLVLKHQIQIVFCMDVNFDARSYLRLFKSRRLYNAWECLEIIRCQSAKSNTIPCSWVTNDTNYDEIPLYEMQIIMWISMICETFIQKKMKCKKLKCSLPSYEQIQQIALFKYRIKRVKKLLDFYDCQKSLNTFQFKSIYFTYDALTSFRNDTNFEKYLGNKSRNELDLVSRRIDELPRIEIPNCTVCGEKLLSKSCLDSHPSHQCSISLVPISGIPKWECFVCDLPVDGENEDKTELFCVLCDLPLIQNF